MPLLLLAGHDHDNNFGITICFYLVPEQLMISLWLTLAARLIPLVDQIIA